MASNCIKAFVPVYYFIGIITGTKIHHVAIGGGLYGYLQNHKFAKYMISNASGIYSELRSYTVRLRDIGLTNTYTMPNFKYLDIIEKNDLKTINTSPLKLCTFSRVMPEKGIVDAINSVIKINTKFNKEVYSLDIFGQVDSKYIDEFENLQKSFPSYIKYRGVIEQEKSTNVLKDYYLLLFPTHYKTEGLPGSIIDAYTAGVPVIASRWQGFSDVILEGITGFGYEMKNQKELNNILVNLIDDSLVNIMRLNCIQEAQKYTPKNAISVLVDKLK
jgi:glycosyltransferase involved in cell wall biosynthesis